MQSDFVEQAATSHQKDPRSILSGGDGSARFAIDFRKAHPDATFWEIVDAVAEYRKNITPQPVAPGLKMKMKSDTAQRRRALEERLHSTYKLAPNREGGCIYCGATSSGKDHVPPLFHAETVSKDGSGRWLHDCCGPCNVLLSSYPAVCLKVRAEYLLCILRREWLLTRNGLKRKYPNSVISTKGLRVKARLAAGITQGLCLCKKCEAIREQKPELPRGAPYGGKEISYGLGWFSVGFGDEGSGL